MWFFLFVFFRVLSRLSLTSFSRSLFIEPIYISIFSTYLTAYEQFWTKSVFRIDFRFRASLFITYQSIVEMSLVFLSFFLFFFSKSYTCTKCVPMLIIKLKLESRPNLLSLFQRISLSLYLPSLSISFSCLLSFFFFLSFFF